jgi:hypothetical protein
VRCDFHPHPTKVCGELCPPAALDPCPTPIVTLAVTSLCVGWRARSDRGTMILAMSAAALIPIQAILSCRRREGSRVELNYYKKYREAGKIVAVQDDSSNGVFHIVSFLPFSPVVVLVQIRHSLLIFRLSNVLNPKRPLGTGNSVAAYSG